jgi:hypothetical protein
MIYITPINQKGEEVDDSWEMTTNATATFCQTKKVSLSLSKRTIGSCGDQLTKS